MKNILTSIITLLRLIFLGTYNVWLINVIFGLFGIKLSKLALFVLALLAVFAVYVAVIKYAKIKKTRRRIEVGDSTSKFKSLGFKRDYQFEIEKWSDSRSALIFDDKEVLALGYLSPDAVVAMYLKCLEEGWYDETREIQTVDPND